MRAHRQLLVFSGPGRRITTALVVLLVLSFAYPISSALAEGRRRPVSTPGGKRSCSPGSEASDETPGRGYHENDEHRAPHHACADA